MLNEYEFLNRINERRTVVAVIGLGNTGLPVALGCIDRGFPVRGIDIDATKVEDLNSGRSYLPYLPDQEIQALLAGSFLAGTDFCAVAGADIAIVCVPTPLGADGDADLSSVYRAFDAIATYASRGTLVILQSTVPPGTTEVLATRLATMSGLTVGSDLFVAFAPERIDPANTAGWSVRTIPRVVGGVTPACMRRASAVLEALCAKAVTVSDTRTAEMTKIVENAFRLVNIVLANEISDMCAELGVSEREVVEAASTKPFAFLAHRPGPGIGGDCIPVVPAFLLAHARRSGVAMPIVTTAHRQIDQRPDYVVARLSELLTRHGSRIGASRVLVLGVAYKENVNDTRNAPALRIIERLRQLGATVAYHDPLVPVLTVGGHRLEGQPCDAAGHDCAVLVTPHPEILDRIDPALFPIVLDTRHVLPAGGTVEWL